MKTEIRTAAANFKYNKTRNLLVGVAICLTTLLLFIIPGATQAMMKLEKEAVRRTYPTWDTVLRNVEADIAEKTAVRENVAKAGLRCDVGEIPSENASIGMTAMDETCAKLNRMELLEGTFPKKEQEIVVSEGILEALGIDAEVGDTIQIPYQVKREDGLDYRQEGEFVICGMLKDAKEQKEKKMYGAFVSEAFAKQLFSQEDIRYYVYIQLAVKDSASYESVVDEIDELAAAFGLNEDDYGKNTERIAANYVDPSVIPIVVIMMTVVIIAGIITIYSIYYVSMPQRIQDYGKLRAIGATRKQIRRIVLVEGLLTAGIAVPIGLLLGTPFIKVGMYELLEAAGKMNAAFVKTTLEIIEEGSINLHPVWLYAFAAGIAFITVWLSLFKPMKMAAKITPVEAMRFQGQIDKKKSRKGYFSLNLLRLTKVNLARNKKRTVITVLSMGMTGILFLTVATLLACADPREISDAAVEGRYQLQIESESGNKEHPEREWSVIQKNNPLDEAFAEEIEKISGVTETAYVKWLKGTFDYEGEEISEGLTALPEKNEEELIKGIEEGTFDKEGWENGTKILVSDTFLRWYPDIQVGKQYTFRIENGDEILEKKLEVMGILDVPYRLCDYGYVFTSRTAMDKLEKYNANDGIFIYADKEYDQKIEEKLQAIADADERLGLITWQEEYEMWVSSMALIRLACFAFLGVLGAICIMNLINTVLNSIHMRMKEIGMMQAIGLSQSQLMKMLQMEGLFYTAGALLLAMGAGSLAGYGAFFYARETGMFNIQYYHYPTVSAAIMCTLVLLIQVLLVFLIGRSLKKQTMIDRIRFHE